MTLRTISAAEMTSAETTRNICCICWCVIVLCSADRPSSENQVFNRTNSSSPDVEEGFLYHRALDACEAIEKKEQSVILWPLADLFHR